MCLWKLLILGWTRPKSTDTDDCKEGGNIHRQHHTSSDDEMSDSGISSGEFSLENVCEDSYNLCSAPQPTTPAPLLPAQIVDNRQVDVVIYYIISLFRAVCLVN